MISVYTSGIQPGISEMLLDCMKEVSDHQTENKLAAMQLEYAADTHEETRGLLERVETISAFFIGVAGADEQSIREATDLGEACRQNNRDHYLVYVLSDEAALLDLLPYMIDISGVLFPPFRREKMVQVLDKIAQDYRLMTRLEDGKQSAFVALKYLGSLIRLRPDTIQYVEAMDKKLQIHHLEKDISVYEKMGNMQRKLGNRFFQCHRSYLVNCASIYRIDIPKMEIELFDGTLIPIARSYRAQALDLQKQMEEEGSLAETR